MPNFIYFFVTTGVLTHFFLHGAVSSLYYRDDISTLLLATSPFMVICDEPAQLLQMLEINNGQKEERRGFLTCCLVRIAWEC